MVILTRRKTDQEGQGSRIGVPHGIHPATCPVGAVRAWLDRAGIADGPVFRAITKGGRVRTGRLGDRTVARVVQEAVAGVGLDPAEFGGHSLRAGLATSAAAHGVEERKIMDQTGHKCSRKMSHGVGSRLRSGYALPASQANGILIVIDATLST